MLRDPEFVPEADVLLVESTYGNRTHSRLDAEALAATLRQELHWNASVPTDQQKVALVAGVSDNT